MTAFHLGIKDQKPRFRSSIIAIKSTFAGWVVSRNFFRLPSPGGVVDSAVMSKATVWVRPRFKPTKREGEARRAEKRALDVLVFNLDLPAELPRRKTQNREHGKA